METPQILVVEDEAITAMDMERRLIRLGYRVPAVAGSAREALLLASETHPDLVLMDIQLGGGPDGITAAEELGERLDLPVTYVTAYADDATLARARSTSPYGFLIKPFDERELHAVIQMA